MLKRSTAKQAITRMLVAAVGATASCADSEPDDARASDAELEQITAKIQPAAGPAAVVSATMEERGLVTPPMAVRCESLEEVPAQLENVIGSWGSPVLSPVAPSGWPPT